MERELEDRERELLREKEEMERNPSRENEEREIQLLREKERLKKSDDSIN